MNRLARILMLASLLAAPSAALSQAAGQTMDYVDELNFYDTELHLVLKTLGEKTGYSFIEDVPVRGKVTIHISKRTAIADVLDQILRGLNLSWRLEKGVYHIDQKLPLKAMPVGKGLVARTYVIRHIAADTAAESIRPILSEHGKVTADIGMNTLTVTDMAEVQDSVRTKLDALDVEGKRPSQFNIKIRVLHILHDGEANAGAEFSWNKYNAFEAIGTNFFENTNTIEGWGQTYDGAPYNSGFRQGDEDYAFYDSAFTFRVGHFAIDELIARFVASQEDAKVNILSEPDVTVSNGKKARILMGEKVPQKKSGGGFDFQQVGIILEVTPKLVGEDRIELDLKPSITERSLEPKMVNTEVLNSREINTIIEMVSGETLRIGGLSFTNSIKIEKKVPILGELPLLGYLFKLETAVEREEEVVILVSPHLVEHIPPRSATTAGISALSANLVTGTTDVMLDWAADVPFDNVGVVRYHVYRDVQPIIATLGLIPLSRAVRGDATSWIDRFPKRRGVTYYYAVTAVDGAGNEQAVSNSPNVAIPKR